jgi:hypothetical protein
MGIPLIVLAAASLGSLVLAIVRLFQTLRFLRGAHRCEGRVVRWEKSEGSSLSRERIEFAAADGTTHAIRGARSRNPDAQRIGTNYSIVYPAANPDRARIRTVMGVWGGVVAPSTFFALSGGFVTALLVIASATGSR